MTSSENLERTNGMSSDPVLASAESNISRIDNQEFNQRMATLEEWQNKENIQIKQLQDKIEKLEEEAREHKNQIKNLEDKVKNLQCHASTGSGMQSVISTDVEGNVSQSEPSNIKQVRPTTSNKQLDNITKDQDGTKDRESKETTGRSVGCGSFVFTRWMNSRDGDLSLWANENYRNPLLSYIGKIYGQKNNIRRVLEPLKIELNNSSELDQLYDVIKQFEKQPNAKKSLREWRLQSRSNSRLIELKAIFEFNSAYPSKLDDWKMTSSSNLQKIINRESINAYFDMICRDGLVTAEIGEYLNLNKENIFGGTDYDSHNNRVTLVNVNLSQSTIDLADNRVDLITCFVTLHHVPHLRPILSEFVRILRPGGYLILREHDCKNTRSLLAKYLNFVHAFMMIARVGEFDNASANDINEKQDDSESDTTDWEQQKSNIIKHTNSIQYRTHDEWRQELERVGFHHKVTLEYNAKINNPQAIHYAVYQLHTK